MNVKQIIFFFIIAQFFLVNAWAIETLTDQQLNSVAGGSVQHADKSQNALTRIPFNYSSGKGHVDGEVLVLPMNTYNQQGTLQLSDNAQSNLRSLINVNAVNSPVQILLNLNINVNSTIGSVNQLNNLLSNQVTWD